MGSMDALGRSLYETYESCSLHSLSSEGAEEPPAERKYEEAPCSFSRCSISTASIYSFMIYFGLEVP